MFPYEYRYFLFLFFKITWNKEMLKYLQDISLSVKVSKCKKSKEFIFEEVIFHLFYSNEFDLDL